MKPKVVILASRFPYPLVKGDKVRLYHQMKLLSQHFNLHLLCISQNWPDQSGLEALRSFCSSVSVYLLSIRQRRINILTHYFHKMPMQVRYFYDRHIHDDMIREITLIQPDHIYVQLIRMAPYAARLNGRIPISIDYMDSMTLNDLADQYLGRIPEFFKARERELVRAYESDIFSMFRHRFIISRRDKNEFPPLLRQSLKILSNGVDQQYFKYKSQNSHQKYDILFCGNLSYRPNIEAVLYILNEIFPLIKDIHGLIAGANKSSTLDEKIKSILNPLKKLSKNSLDVRGYQKDLREIYYSGKIMIVPIFSGSGQQNKVLEAMSCGTPCIVTSFVNEGIKADPGLEILVADDAKGFVTHIKNLLSQPEKRIAMSMAARKLIERKFDWSVNTNTLIATIEKDVNK